MSVYTGQSVTTEFTTRAFATGAATNADSLPTGTLYLNGTANGAAVTVTNITTGIYKARVTMPTLANGDLVALVISATVSAISDNAKVWEDSADLVTLTTNVNSILVAVNLLSPDLIAAAVVSAIGGLVTVSGTSGSSGTAQPIELAPYAKKIISLTMAPTTDISGWTFTMTIRQNGVVKLTKAGVIVSASGGVASFSYTGTETGTLAEGNYDYDVWRTNSGAETQLAIGPLIVTPQYRT
jgi:hypothetical protein